MEERVETTLCFRGSFVVVDSSYQVVDKVLMFLKCLHDAGCDERDDMG